MPERDDASLLAAAARGDERAFEAFYRRHLAAVTGFHLRRTGRRELAFDLTAETFAAVVVALDRYDPERASATTWLFSWFATTDAKRAVSLSVNALLATASA